MTPFIRFFGLVKESGEMADLAFSCAQEFERVGWKARVIPIGAVDLTQGRWSQYTHYLTVPVEDPFVNVVCANQAWLRYCFWSSSVNIAVTPHLIDVPSPYKLWYPTASRLVEGLVNLFRQDEPCTSSM